MIKVIGSAVYVKLSPAVPEYSPTDSVVYSVVPLPTH